jgi:Plasmid pRiA4b ORF-3-like protein
LIATSSASAHSSWPPSRKRAIEYVYDYGDNWRLAIVIEALQPALPGVVYPRLAEGARRGPPEDIGGACGYAEFLEAIADPSHERHAELTEWSGGDFDPNDLAIDDINAALSQLAKPKKLRRRSVTT